MRPSGSGGFAPTPDIERLIMTPFDPDHVPAGPGRPLWLVADLLGDEQMPDPMPQLACGIVWSDVVAEIERDRPARERDAA